MRIHKNLGLGVAAGFMLLAGAFVMPAFAATPDSTAVTATSVKVVKSTSNTEHVRTVTSGKEASATSLDQTSNGSVHNPVNSVSAVSVDSKDSQSLNEHSKTSNSNEKVDAKAVSYNATNDGCNPCGGSNVSNLSANELHQQKSDSHVAYDKSTTSSHEANAKALNQVDTRYLNAVNAESTHEKSSQAEVTHYVANDKRAEVSTSTLNQNTASDCCNSLANSKATTSHAMSQDSNMVYDNAKTGMSERSADSLHQVVGVSGWYPVTAVSSSHSDENNAYNEVTHMDSNMNHNELHQRASEQTLAESFCGCNLGTISAVKASSLDAVNHTSSANSYHARNDVHSMNNSNLNYVNVAGFDGCNSGCNNNWGSNGNCNSNCGNNMWSGCDCEGNVSGWSNNWSKPESFLTSNSLHESDTASSLETSNMVNNHSMLDTTNLDQFVQTSDCGCGDLSHTIATSTHAASNYNLNDMFNTGNTTYESTANTLNLNNLGVSALSSLGSVLGGNVMLNGGLNIVDLQSWNKTFSVQLSNTYSVGPVNLAFGQIFNVTFDASQYLYLWA